MAGVLIRVAARRCGESVSNLRQRFGRCGEESSIEGAGNAVQRPPPLAPTPSLPQARHRLSLSSLPPSPILPSVAVSVFLLVVCHPRPCHSRPRPRHPRLRHSHLRCPCLRCPFLRVILICMLTSPPRRHCLSVLNILLLSLPFSM